MSTQAAQIIAYTEEKVAQSHSSVYYWTCSIFVVLTALALYVMFTFPQGDI
jgi:hypothetical protein